MAFYYPRKQTVMIFAVSVIAVGAAAWYVKSQPASDLGKAASAAAVVAAIEPTIVDPKLNNTDWQKQFYNKSTGDAFKTSSAKSTAAAPGESLTATDILARNFMMKYMQIHQAGMDTDQQTVSNAANQMIADSLSSVQTPRSFGISDLHVIPNIDRTTLIAYANSISAILNSYIPDQNHNEATIATQALDQNNMALLKSIDPIVANYRQAAAALILVRVPQPLAQYHLNLLNGVAVALFNAKALRNLENDPLTGLAAIGMEITGLQAMSDAQDKIQSYLNAMGVPYGQS